MNFSPLRKTFLQGDGSLDEAVCGIAIGMGSFIGLYAWTVIAKGVPFDGQAFGIGLGAIWTGGGALMRLRKETPISQ